VPITDQIFPNDPREADLIIACECVWLAELAAPLVETIIALMKGPNRPSCLLCYRDRSSGKTTFAGMGHVLDLLKAEGCAVTLLHSYHPTATENRIAADPSRPVNVFEVTLPEGEGKGEVTA
jgi:hypothetical protein